MITLYNSGRFLGLPDMSPFVTKAEVLLKMAGLEYRLDSKGFSKAPRGKIPFINDDDEIVTDSTIIRHHLEKKYHVDFDKGYSAADLAMAWSVEKMLEEHLYFAVAHSRWLNDANFERGPAHLFDFLPALIRSPIKRMVRGKFKKMLHSQGTGRRTEAEIVTLANRDLDAVATLLGNKPYFLGDHPCGADATIFSFVAGVLCPAFESKIREHAESLPNLVAYRDRMMAKYYPELIEGGHSK